MRVALLALAVSASTILAAPHIEIEIDNQRVIAGCDRPEDAASDMPLQGDWMQDFGDNTFSSPDDMLTDEVGASTALAQFDVGLVDAIGWNGTKQFAAYVGAAGNVRAKYYEHGKGWSPSESFFNLGGKMDRTLAIERVGDTVIIAGVSTRSVLQVKYFRDGRFYPSQNSWIYLDDNCMGTPAMASRDGKVMDLVVRGRDGFLYSYSINPQNDEQTYFVRIGDKKGVRNPALVSRKAGVLDVLQYSEETMLQIASFDGKSWGNFRDVNKPYPRGSPTAIARDGKLDFFGVGNGNRVYKQTYDGKNWVNQRGLGGNALQTVSALYYGNAADIYYHDTASVKQGRYGNDGGSNQWNMGGQLRSMPIAFSWDGVRVDIYGIGMNGALYQKYYNHNQGWSGWIYHGGQAKI